LTAREYKLRFDTATKRPDETYTFFAARLRNNLRYYLRSRECLIDYDRLFTLLISDKLKSCLPSGPLNYVLSLEANEWFGPARIAELADTYVSHHGEGETMRQVNSAHVIKDTKTRSVQSKGQFGQTSYDARVSQQCRDISCFCCGGTGHIAKYCPQNEAEEPIRAGEQSQGERQPERVQRCFRCQSSRHLTKDCPKINEVSVNGEQVEDEAQISACFGGIKPSITGRVVYNDRVNRGDADECDRIALMCTLNRDDAIDECKATTWEFDVYPQIKMVTSNCTGVVNTRVKLSNLKHLDVMVNGERCVSLVDSGAEIKVLSEGLAHKLQVDTCGHINVRSIFSDSMRVPLVNVTLKRCYDMHCDNVAEEVQVVCAVAPLRDMTYDAVFPVDVIADLERLPEMNVMRVKDNNSAVVDNEFNGIACEMSEVKADGDHSDDVADDCDSDVMNTDQIMMCEIECGNDELLDAQMDDVSLNACWEMAKLNKSNFVIDHGLLYHTDQVEGQKVCKLCVPKLKRDVEMQMAHDSIFIGHLAETKTRERIRLSFFGPKMRQNIKQFVKTCQDCQLRSRPKTLDRVPIVPITRAEVPFQDNMGCIGPIDSPSAPGHRYCLYFILFTIVLVGRLYMLVYGRLPRGPLAVRKES